MSRAFSATDHVNYVAKEIQAALKGNCFNVYLLIPGNDYNLRVTGCRTIRGKLWVTILGAANLYPVDDHSQLTIQ